MERNSLFLKIASCLDRLFEGKFIKAFLDVAHVESTDDGFGDFGLLVSVTPVNWCELVLLAVLLIGEDLIVWSVFNHTPGSFRSPQLLQSVITDRTDAEFPA